MARKKDLLKAFDEDDFETSNSASKYDYNYLME